MHGGTLPCKVCDQVKLHEIKPCFFFRNLFLDRDVTSIWRLARACLYHVSMVRPASSSELVKRCLLWLLHIHLLQDVFAPAIKGQRFDLVWNMRISSKGIRVFALEDEFDSYYCDRQVSTSPFIMHSGLPFARLAQAYLMYMQYKAACSYSKVLCRGKLLVTSLNARGWIILSDRHPPGIVSDWTGKTTPLAASHFAFYHGYFNLSSGLLICALFPIQ